MKSIVTKAAIGTLATLPMMLSGDALASSVQNREILVVLQAPGHSTGLNAVQTKTGQSTGVSLQIPQALKALSFLEERRFHKLAIKSALGVITPNELAEMEALDDRRSIDKPIKQGTIIARQKLFSKIDDLIEKLDRLSARA